MASEADLGAEGSALDLDQLNLLQVALEELEDAQHGESLARVVYVSRLREKVLSLEDLKLFHVGALTRLGQRRQQVTGMLIIYPTCLAHVVEAPYSVILELLRDLHQRIEASVLGVPRIVYSSEGIRARTYNSWRSAYVDGYGAPESSDPVDQAALVQTLWEFTLKLIQLGGQLSQITGEEKIDTALKSLNTFADIPRPEALLSIASAEDAPTLAEYLELYDAPLNLDLESEMVWPVGEAYTSNVD